MNRFFFNHIGIEQGEGARALLNVPDLEGDHSWRWFEQWLPHANGVLDRLVDASPERRRFTRLTISWLTRVETPRA